MPNEMLIGIYFLQQSEIVKRLSAIIGQILPFLSQEVLNSAVFSTFA